AGDGAVFDLLVVVVQGEAWADEHLSDAADAVGVAVEDADAAEQQSAAPEQAQGDADDQAAGFFADEGVSEARQDPRGDGGQDVDARQSQWRAGMGHGRWGRGAKKAVDKPGWVDSVTALRRRRCPPATSVPK